MKKLLVGIIALAMIVSFFVVNPTPVSADTGSAPEISDYDEIAPRGQLIIAPGQEFVVPAEWDGLRLTVWRGLGDASIDPVIAFANSIGDDRLARYGGELESYATAIWSSHPIPGFTTRKDCDQTFGSDQAVLTAGESIGDAGCFTVLEYDITAILQCTNCTAAEAATCAQETTATIAATTAPVATTTEEEAAVPIVTATPEPTAIPTQTAPVTPVPVNWNWLLGGLGIAAIIGAIALLIHVLRNKGNGDQKPNPTPAPVTVAPKPTVLRKPVVEQGEQKSTTTVENHAVVALPETKQPEYYTKAELTKKGLAPDQVQNFLDNKLTKQQVDGVLQFAQSNVFSKVADTIEKRRKTEIPDQSVVQPRPVQPEPKKATTKVEPEVQPAVEPKKATTKVEPEVQPAVEPKKETNQKNSDTKSKASSKK